MNKTPAPHFDTTAAAPVGASKLFVIDTPDDTACHFWIGLKREGNITSSQLLDIRGTRDRLEKAAQVGFEDQSPHMLVDGQGHPARFLFFIPSEAVDHSAIDQISSKINETIESWGTNNIKPVGFYFDKTLANLSSVKQVLLKVLKEQIEQEPARPFYFLVPQTQQRNAVLDTLLQVKITLAAEKRNLFIFH